MGLFNFLNNRILTQISMDTFDAEGLLYGMTYDITKWIIFAVISLVIFVGIFCLIFYFSAKAKKSAEYHRGQISKSVLDKEGRYNLDTIDNYEDTKKKLEIERNEVQICRKIKEIDPEFSIVKFKSDVCRTFLNMQKYWAEGNLDEMRDLETDELYEQHKNMIEDSRRKNKKNIREDVSIDGCFLNSYLINNGKEVIIVDYIVKMKDYIIELNKEIDKNKIQKDTYIYRVNYVRTEGTKTNAEFEPGENVKCPNCGADVRVSVSEYCPYCNSLITTKEYGWVIANVEKTKIRDNQIKN